MDEDILKKLTTEKIPTSNLNMRRPKRRWKDDIEVTTEEKQAIANSVN